MRDHFMTRPKSLMETRCAKLHRAISRETCFNVTNNNTGREDRFTTTHMFLNVNKNPQRTNGE